MKTDQVIDRSVRRGDLGQDLARSSPTWSNQNACRLNGKIFNLIFIFVLKNQVHLKTYSNGHIAGFRRQMQKFELHLVTFYVLNSTLEVK